MKPKSIPSGLALAAAQNLPNRYTCPRIPNNPNLPIQAIFIAPKPGIYRIQTYLEFLQQGEEINVYDLSYIDSTKSLDIEYFNSDYVTIYKLNMSTGYYDIWGSVPQDNDLELPKPAPKCCCGTSITMGKDDAPEWHSDYCPVYVKPDDK